MGLNLLHLLTDGSPRVRSQVDVVDRILDQGLLALDLQSLLLHGGGVGNIYLDTDEKLGLTLLLGHGGYREKVPEGGPIFLVVQQLDCAFLLLCNGILQFLYGLSVSILPLKKSTVSTQNILT